jgi:hypothetical protein
MDKRLRLVGVLVLVLLSLAAAAPAPILAACNWGACTALCNEAFNQCMDDCGPTYPGDPCATGCRNAKVSCYQRCCA